MSKSLGESRVRTEFNPAKSGLVEDLKQKSAELINLINTIKPTVDEFGKAGNQDVLNLLQEKSRLVSLAQTAYEEAAMWAVKAATI